MKPTANFSFKPNGLSVTFIDRSSGIINSWSWDFGFEDNTPAEVISAVQNPPVVNFPSAGVYTVRLTVSNSDGSDTFSFDVVVATTPGVSLTIREMVQYALPIGLAFDSIGFDQSIRNWQLYLQLAPVPQIADADVFNESKWPPLYNILISKLIIYDLVVKAGTASMSSYISAVESLNSLASSTTTETVQVQDYTAALIPAYPITVNLIIGNGKSFGPSPACADVTALLAWLNALGIGVFAETPNGGGADILSLGTTVLLNTFNYTGPGGGVNESFVASNPRIVPITQALSVDPDASVGDKGPLKHLETGPSKAEWYDSSVYWSNIFKTMGTNGEGGGVLTAIAQEICTYANRLTIQLPMCPKQKTLGRTFIVSRNCPRIPNWLFWPASKGPTFFE